MDADVDAARERETEGGGGEVGLAIADGGDVAIGEETAVTREPTHDLTTTIQSAQNFQYKIKTHTQQPCKSSRETHAM
jgi:hypothetical protein